MSAARKLLSCTWCGGAFMGFPSSKYCPDCRQQRKGGEKSAEALAAMKELADEREGWRHMLRDGTGTVIVPGGNVMNALDDLCAYEEACQAAGIHGPQELRKTLERYRIEKELAKPGEKKSSGKRGNGLPRALLALAMTTREGPGRGTRSTIRTRSGAGRSVGCSARAAATISRRRQRARAGSARSTRGGSGPTEAMAAPTWC